MKQHPSAWNKASAPTYFWLSAAKLASNWTLWQSISSQHCGHIYGHSFCQHFSQHSRLLWWTPWKIRTWQQKVSLVILEADPDIAGALSGCLVLQHKARDGVRSLLGKHGWRQRAWQLNGLVGSIILLTVPRQQVSCKHGAGELSCSCHCLPVTVTSGDSRGGMEGCATSGAERANLYPSHCGFAAQHVHRTHNYLPSNRMPRCLVRPRDTQHDPSAWRSRSPEPRSPNCTAGAAAEHGLLHPMCLWVMRVDPASPPGEGTFAVSLICSPSSALSFLQLSEMGTLFKKRATQKEAVQPRERGVRQNKIIARGGASERLWKKLEHTCSSSPSVFVTSL